MNLRTPLALALGLGLVACGEETSRLPRDAGGTSSDTGVAEDAGTTDPDTGVTDPDSGTEPDAGAMDAGEADAGQMPMGPITAPDDTWTWVDFPNSSCMNGSPTGIGVNLHPGATKVLILLMGGNACFNQASCFVTANLDGYDAAKFNGELGQLNSTPLYDRAASENIFKDYHLVYVPYCTGDVHAGSNPNGSVAGSSYAFVGYDNMGAFLERLVPTFANATDVVLSGVSAGGFGAMLNFDQVQRAFGDDVRVTLVDDSGPPMASTYLASCLQDHFSTTWDFNGGVLADCAECLSSTTGFIEPFFDYLMGLYADRNFAVVSSDGDDVIRGFWGFGQNECRNLNDIFPPAYPAATYRMGLEDFRDNVAMGQSNVGLYMRTMSSRHVWLAPDPIWNITQDGVTLSDWVESAIAGDMSWTSVPTP